MFKHVELNRLKGTAKSFDVSMVEGGYLRTYGGMLAIGCKHNNKRRDEFSVSLADVKTFIAEHEKQVAEAALATQESAPMINGICCDCAKLPDGVSGCCDYTEMLQCPHKQENGKCWEAAPQGSCTP